MVCLLLSELFCGWQSIVTSRGRNKGKYCRMITWQSTSLFDPSTSHMWNQACYWGLDSFGKFSVKLVEKPLQGLESKGWPLHDYFGIVPWGARARWSVKIRVSRRTANYWCHNTKCFCTCRWTTSDVSKWKLSESKRERKKERERCNASPELNGMSVLHLLQCFNLYPANVENWVSS
jgi:hypothetical protein